MREVVYNLIFIYDVCDVFQWHIRLCQSSEKKNKYLTNFTYVTTLNEGYDRIECGKLVACYKIAFEKEDEEGEKKTGKTRKLHGAYEMEHGKRQTYKQFARAKVFNWNN